MYKNRHHLELLEMSYHYSAEAKKQSRHFCSAAWASMCDCGTSLFQYSAAMSARFSGLPYYFHSVDIPCYLLSTQTSGNLKGPSPDCWENQGALPSQTFQFSPMLSVQCGSVHYCVEEWCVFSLDAHCEVHVTVSHASEHSKLHWHFLFLGRKSTRMQLPASQKTVPIVFPVKGKVLALVFFVEAAWHHSMLCHFVSGSKWWIQLSSKGTKFSTNLLPSEACPCVKCQAVLLFPWLHSAVQKFPD